MSFGAGARQRLAQHVVTRRAELGLSQVQVLERGGPSVGTQQAIEEGREQRYQAQTLAKVDAGLQWFTGSALDVLSTGAEPRPIETAPIAHLAGIRPEPYVSDADNLDAKTPAELHAEINARLEALARKARAGNPDAE